MRKLRSKAKFSPEDAATKFKAYRLTSNDITELPIKILREDCAVYDEAGKLLAMLIKEALPERLTDEAYSHALKIKGDPSNRPEIFGAGARMNRIRADGTLSHRIATPQSIVKLVKGQANMLGSYRYKNPSKGEVHCDTTGFTRKHPDIYEGLAPFILAVDEVYKQYAPAEYARQMEYVSELLSEWRTYNTAFSTVYFIRDLPTACHIDRFDIPEGFGCMATLGGFEGCEFVLPEYGVGFDYQPGDVLLADVHHWHGNLPLRSGTRIAAVFFCRKGMHECS